MKLFFVLLLVACASNKSHLRAPANASVDLINSFEEERLEQEREHERKNAYCRGNAPSGDAWCDYVCIDGRWARICR